MTIVGQMADFAVLPNFESLSAGVRAQLKIRMLDTLGCAIGATGTDRMLRLRQYVGDFSQYGKCSLVGGGRSSPDRAALMNGALVAHLDFNDSYLAPEETCHPSDNFGAVLAAAELANADGGTLLTALAVAYQVQCRLSDEAPARTEGVDHPALLAYSAAAGISRALSLDAPHTANAIAISGRALNPLRAARTATSSDWTRLGAPFTASIAMQATLLARRGVTGPSEIFEGSKVLMDTISGFRMIDWTNEGLDRVEATIVKRHHAHLHAQTAIEAALELQLVNDFDSDQIERVDVEIFEAAGPLVREGEHDVSHTLTSEDAYNNLHYLIAVALLDREVMPGQFAEERIRRADVQALLSRVAVHPVPDHSRLFPGEMPSTVSVTLKDGRVLRQALSDYPGFRSRPQTWEDALSKFYVLASPHASDGVLGEISDTVQDVEKVRVADLTRLLRDLGQPVQADVRNVA
jgi:2-methylcitrate dehydratase